MTPDDLKREDFERTRNACALLARSTVFAQLTIRHKVDPETAVAVSTELYMELKSLTFDQVEQEK